MINVSNIEGINVVKEDMVKSVKPGKISLRDMAPGFFNQQYRNETKKDVEYTMPTLRL